MATKTQVIDIIHKVSAAIGENAQFLTDLDNAIGDGDHGINLARGFKKVEEELPAVADKDIGAILKKVGMTLVSTVGGASGPLYGTAFMKAGDAVKEKEEVTAEDFIAMLEAGIGGVQLRGKAEKGEKTMLDAMIPALDAMREAGTADAKAMLEAGLKAAKEGVEYTKTIIATKGRASYLGERSIGHQDPGASSFTVILETVANTV
ncbi:MAG: dihydroxyacetone kinase subunit L [Lachnospiraceae bacterium]|nr:dihydroxyacetone kinase subunit L [Lachnospiraceae bacterium]